MIREAEKADIEQLTAIFEQLHTRHFEMRQDYFKLPDKSFYGNMLEEFLGNDNYRIIVFAENELILGYAVAQIFEREDNMHAFRRKCMLEQLAVEKAFRNRKIGSELLEAVKKYAMENMCSSVELGVWYENYGAVDFYALAGFKPRIINMELILEEEK